MNFAIAIIGFIYSILFFDKITDITPSYYSDRAIPLLNIDSINNANNWNFEIKDLEQNFRFISKLITYPDSIEYYHRDTIIKYDKTIDYVGLNYSKNHFKKDKYKMDFFLSSYDIIQENIGKRDGWFYHALRIKSRIDNKMLFFIFNKFFLVNRKDRLTYNVWRYSFYTSRMGFNWDAKRDLVTWPDDSTETVYIYDTPTIDDNPNNK